MMKIINMDTFRDLSSEAQDSVRLRKNLNFHDSYEDPSQRMLVAIEPGSYVRPHRHLATPKSEAFLALKGRLALIIFNDDGSVQEGIIMGPNEETFGVDLQVGAWHSIVCLESGTIFYENKPGPYCAIPDDDMAPWAPAEGDNQVSSYLQSLITAVTNCAYL